MNHIRVGEGRSTTIEAWHSGFPTFWKLSGGAQLDEATAYEGHHAIALHGGADGAIASVFSDYWRVKDPGMPFGTPLLADVPVQVAFRYRNSSDWQGTFTAEVQLGTITDLPSDTQTQTPEAAADWRQVSLSLTPAELRWGASVTFRVPAGGHGTVWVDDISVSQDWGEPTNLVRNPDFEDLVPGSDWPTSWEPPMDDQWVSWVGNTYRAPGLAASAHTGRRSVRATVTYAEISGLSQVVPLNQEVARPIAVSLWCKLDNSIGNGPVSGYYGSDNLPNLTLFVYHQDGTMQEVPPTFSLGESDHDWDFRRGGFLPQKPVNRIRVQVTVLGTEPTTSLWIDDVEVSEVAESPGGLPSAADVPRRSLPSTWGNHAGIAGVGAQATMNSDQLSLYIPRAGGEGETRVYLNPATGAPPAYPHRYLFHVVRIAGDGIVTLGDVVEKQGYVAEGAFRNAEVERVVSFAQATGIEISIPWAALGLSGPPDQAIGFNIQHGGPVDATFWNGKSAATAEMGTLLPAVPPGLSIRSLRFGNRYEEETDQSQDLVSHPPVYAGGNDGTVWIQNTGEATKFTLSAGMEGHPGFEGSATMAAGETKAIPFHYDAGHDGLGQFVIALRQGDRVLLSDQYPLVAPPAVELVLDQEYYFPEETTARLDVFTRYRPLPAEGHAEVSVRDLVSGDLVFTMRHTADAPETSLDFPLDGLRANDLPVQDYAVTLTLQDEKGNELGTAERRFGRIRHTRRHTLPPIESVSVDNTGRLWINGDFRFFPVVPSLNSERWDEGIDLGGNMYRPIYTPGSDQPERDKTMVAAADKAWSKNVYLLPIGPGPGQVEAFEQEVPEIFAHPGFLGCYPKQFYYWNLDDSLVAYRKHVEGLFAAQPSRRLIVWGHHDSSFLYDHDMTWPTDHDPVGYCYVKIMGRPGSTWRNAPFLTRTEQILDPERFKLAEVNLYVAWHDDEIVPEHFSTYYSLRADPMDGFRNESYLSVIYGADGLYHYICVQPGGVQRLRGWFQELNFMWPIFAADDATEPVTVSPPDSGIDVRVKAYEGRLYLLAANAGERPTNATIQIAGIAGKRIQKLFDLPGGMAVDGNTLSDHWEAQDAFVYEISAK